MRDHSQGLEDQLLALVVNHERPDLQEQAAALVSQLGQYTITLKELEDSQLARLANAQVQCTVHIYSFLVPWQHGPLVSRLLPVLRQCLLLLNFDFPNPPPG